MKKITENLFYYEDTCNVYIIKNGKQAILIDFGNGDILDYLYQIDVTEVTDILLTHHHRDQGQGLERARDEDIRIWVPETERQLFTDVDQHWAARELYNNYNGRQDRFSILQSIDEVSSLLDYEVLTLNDYQFQIIPTPGHTTGSISFLTTIDDQKVIFSGDLIYQPGKIQSLAATQWTYNGGEGIPLTVLSLLDVKKHQPDLLLPSHGKLIKNTSEAIDLTVNNLWELLKFRDQNPRLFDLAEKPYEQITPHLLFNRTSMSNAYVLLSESGKALLIDYGYDFVGGIAAGYDRASRRPWLYTIDKLKQDYGVTDIDVAIPTHYHDDHVAGMNLLQRVEGTEIWCPDLFVDVLENPTNYDLPCLWFDPIKADRTLPLEQKLTWQEYELTLSHQSGHAYHAVTISFEVDGKNVLAVGDQYEDTDGARASYVYNNGFRPWDYRDSANLYQKLNPDLILFGHREPLWVTPEYLKILHEKGKQLEELHQKILPSHVLDLRGEDSVIRLSPYQTEVEDGKWSTIEVYLSNPFEDTINIDLSLVVPSIWKVNNKDTHIQLAPFEKIKIPFEYAAVKTSDHEMERVAVDLTINNKHLGQLAEAVVYFKK